MPNKTFFGNENNPDELWQAIFQNLSQSSQEIQTIHQDGEKGSWFLASVRGKNIYVNKSEKNPRLSDINVERTIKKEEFMKIYPLFCPWRKKAIERGEITSKSKNSSYILALIYHYGTMNEK